MQQYWNEGFPQRNISEGQKYYAPHCVQGFNINVSELFSVFPQCFESSTVSEIRLFHSRVCIWGEMEDNPQHVPFKGSMCYWIAHWHNDHKLSVLAELFLLRVWITCTRHSIILWTGCPWYEDSISFAKSYPDSHPNKTLTNSLLKWCYQIPNCCGERASLRNTFSRGK